MSNPTPLLAVLLAVVACTSDRQAPLTLLPAATDVQGASGVLAFDRDTELKLTAAARDITARLDVEKPAQDARFFRLELVVLDAARQPLPDVPMLNVAPNDLKQLNSQRTGKFSLRFRAEMPAGKVTPAGESRRKRRDNAAAQPAWAQNARYFLLRAETGQLAEQPTHVPEPLPADTDRTKTVPEIVVMAEPAVFFVYSFDDAGNGIKQGSGFFIDPLGIGVSNHHVFEGGTQWAIQTTDKRQYRVSEILQSNKEYDHVVFRVEAASPFPYLKIALGKAVKGEDILVIGNPRGLESTVTQGIVSALRDPMIQIDAAVSPGNSGGPVLNRRGEVLGIATQKVPDCENCNFAFDIRVLGYGK